MNAELKTALLVSDVPLRIITLSEQPYMRHGAVDLDNGYLLSVLRAQDIVELHKLSINSPGVAVCYPKHYPYMGLVPN